MRTPGTEPDRIVAVLRQIARSGTLQQQLAQHLIAREFDGQARWYVAAPDDSQRARVGSMGMK